MKKFELTSEFVLNVSGGKLFQIKALIQFSNINAGELGGYIEKEENLNQGGNAWVYDTARISGDARVSGDAWVYGNAWVLGDARVSGDARVFGDARVSDDAWVYGNALVYGDARVSVNARVSGNALVKKSTHLFQLGALGSRNGFTTFFRVKTNKIHVVCGCFLGSIEDFEKAVAITHAGTKHEKTYLLAIELAKLQIELDEIEGEEPTEG